MIVLWLTSLLEVGNTISTYFILCIVTIFCDCTLIDIITGSRWYYFYLLYFMYCNNILWLYFDWHHDWNIWCSFSFSTYNNASRRPIFAHGKVPYFLNNLLILSPTKIFHMGVVENCTNSKYTFAFKCKLHHCRKITCDIYRLSCISLLLNSMASPLLRTLQIVTNVVKPKRPLHVLTLTFYILSPHHCPNISQQVK